MGKPINARAHAEAVTGRKWDDLTPAQQRDPMGFMPDGGPLPSDAASLTDHDYWGTPDYLCRAIVRALIGKLFTPMSPDTILEPTAGMGAFIRALLDEGFDKRKIVAVEQERLLIPDLRALLPPVNVIHTDFLTLANFNPDTVRRSDTVVGIGNPPYRQARDLEFIEAMKRACDAFALILPLTLLEPCENRSLFIDCRFKSFRAGLEAVYPLRRVSFINLLGGPSNVGKRPVAVYVYRRHALFGWDIPHPHISPPIIDFGMQDVMDRESAPCES